MPIFIARKNYICTHTKRSEIRMIMMLHVQWVSAVCHLVLWENSRHMRIWLIRNNGKCLSSFGKALLTYLVNFFVTKNLKCQVISQHLETPGLKVWGMMAVCHEKIHLSKLNKTKMKQPTSWQCAFKIDWLLGVGSNPLHSFQCKLWPI